MEIFYAYMNYSEMPVSARNKPKLLANVNIEIHFCQSIQANLVSSD